jgi:hypothetical protein
VALDRGKLVVVQPLMVTTIVWLANRETAMPVVEGSAAETLHADPSPA